MKTLNKNSNKTYRAKKSLGQNFLKSNLALNTIIKTGEISKEDIILEIGPGKGALTEKLLETAGQVIAVEKDRELFAMLQEKFKEEIKEEKLILIQDDILKFEISSAGQNFSRVLGSAPGNPQGLNQTSSKTFAPLRYKIIANIPYNITGAILKKFLTEKHQPLMMVLMVQNEVAKRIVARDGKESILSISVKAYGEPKIIMKVPARYFTPAPKVDSAVIVIKNISRRVFEENKIDEEKFWQIVKIGFAHKRKKLSGNLKNILPKEQSSVLNQYKDERAEDLSLKDWITLVKASIL